MCSKMASSERTLDTCTYKRTYQWQYSESWLQSFKFNVIAGFGIAAWLAPSPPGPMLVLSDYY